MSAPVNEARRSADSREMGLRLLSGVLLALAAIAVTVWGGDYTFLAFWVVAAALACDEWIALFTKVDRKWARLLAVVSIGAAGAAAQAGLLLAALAVLLVGSCGVAWLTGRASAFGVPYAAPIALGPVLLHNDPLLGVAAILWLFAVVWGTDVAAYVGGRAIGGPRLWRAVSPKKTWSGATVGAVFGTAASVGVAAMFGLHGVGPLIVAGFVLSIATQAGDLFESAVKRRVGVKDSGHIIPGHGGIMDRLDGFTAAAFIAAVIGVARGGTDAAAQGLLTW